MICSECNAEENGVFCTICGSRLAAARPTKKDALVAGLAAAAVAAGAFMPWVKLGFISASGLEGDGRLTLALAAAAGVLILTLANCSHRGGLADTVCVALLLIGMLVLGISVYDIIHVNAIKDTDKIFASSVRPGEGLYLTAAGGAGLIIGSFMGILRFN